METGCFSTAAAEDVGDGDAICGEITRLLMTPLAYHLVMGVNRMRHLGKDWSLESRILS